MKVFEALGMGKMSQFLKKRKLSLKQLEMLVFLSNQNGPVAMKIVLDFFDVLPSTGTSILDGLVSKKLVSRVDSKIDRRSFELKLSKAGRHFCKEVQEFFG